VQVTRLRLNGFKSFVDPTELVVAPGLTGVVGPNGCGKSNLLEALRWVMGENRPTAMRGSGMEDVIFAGTAGRPARAHAEVGLTLDNRDRTAPQGMNEADQLEVLRRITRDLGSAYRVNGREVRARDVQMLFADASTGAHSPALVRQGQIAELIAAKPAARRRVLEEAAGISGLWQRRHEAELKLNATAANLTRVDDVIDGLAQQLAQLARQAKQAARYREIAAELRRVEAQALYRRWADARDALAAREGALGGALAAAAAAEAEAGRTARAREAADAAMPPLRENAAAAEAARARLEAEAARLADRAARAEAAIEAARGRAARAERDRSREEALLADAQAAGAALEQEQATLAEAEAGADATLDRLRAAAATAEARLGAAEARLDRLTEEAGRLQAASESANRAEADASAAADRAARDMAAAQQEVATAGAAATAARAARDRAVAAAETAQQAADRAGAALDASEAVLAAARQAETAARAALGEAGARTRALAAEVTALEKLADPGPEGAALIDDIAVEPGFEAALGAVLGADLTDPAASWARLDIVEAPPWPAGVVPLAPHVSLPGPLGRRLGFVGLVSPEAGAGLQPGLAPGQALVSRQGDLWRWDGLVRPAGAANAAAERLARANRLVALRAELTEARAAEAKAQAAQAAAEADRKGAADRVADARAARDRAEAERTGALRARAEAEAAAHRADSRRAAARDAAERAEQAGTAARTRLEEARQAQAGLADPEAARRQMAAQRDTVSQARAAMLAARAEAGAAERAHAARAARQAEIARESGVWRDRAGAATARIAELAAEAEEARAALVEAEGAPEAIAADRARLAEARAAAETNRQSAADALAEAEAVLRQASTAERTAERAASEAREARARAEAVRDGAATALADAETRIAEETDTDPDGLRAALPETADLAMPADRLEADILRLKRQRDALGAVNLRAEEDARELRIEHDRLVEEKRDLETAIARLREGIAGLNREGRARLLTAFETVNGHFAALFAHLFGGGTAKLVLVESDDPLEAGLEIMAQPPGKRLATLSLLSGGEQTLTALALIFAVFLANPAPICVLDEVDAPLDDANVGRFCDLLDEMTRRTETRFLIITHNAISMARMDRLFGVTMAEQGVSQLVSVDLRRAEAMVA
jgi:chromosome segregation protein